jgi:hypothetical protein
MKRIVTLDPGTYQRHLIHGEGRTWAETNCYVDLWIELLHALGHEPIAALPFTLAIDFEGDQWTFFKFPLADLYELYGLDVQELAIWRPLVEHVDEQVGRGRPVLVELDSYFLPDTVGTAYKTGHVKTTVAVNEIDIEAKHLGYFHNQGYFHLDGDDFTDIFRLRGTPDPAVLPPYVEFVKGAHRALLQGEKLLHASLALLRKHLGYLPEHNPFIAFRQRFQQDLPWLMNEDLQTFHQYSFATLRQYGACFELVATYLDWLARQGQSAVAPATAAFADISTSAKAFQFQLARAMSRKKELDLSPLEAMGRQWERGTSLLQTLYR